LRILGKALEVELRLIEAPELVEMVVGGARVVVNFTKAVIFASVE
jgi:hypothetical protein